MIPGYDDWKLDNPYNCQDELESVEFVEIDGEHAVFTVCTRKGAQYTSRIGTEDILPDILLEGPEINTSDCGIIGCEDDELIVAINEEYPEYGTIRIPLNSIENEIFEKIDV